MGHNQRSSAQDLLYPKPAFRARDHHRDNLRQMRQAQENSRHTKTQADADSCQPLYKDPAYANVRSRVDRSGHAAPGAAYAGGGENGSAPAPMPQREFLQAGSKKQAGPPPRPDHAYVSRKEKRLQEQVPTAAETAAETRRMRQEAAAAKGRGGGGGGQRAGARQDFVRQNKEQAERRQAQAAAERKKDAMVERAAPSTKDNGEFGKVPDYLRHRKVELQEEKEYLRSLTQKSDLPDGYRQLPDDQRKQLLESLRVSHGLQLRSLWRIPTAAVS